MFSTSLIIDNLNTNEFVEYKKLCKLLNISKKGDKARLDIALNALERLNIIKKNERNEFENTKDEIHVTAKIRCSSKGYCFAVRDNLNEDIYIKENLLNYAWNGDKVLVRIIKEGIRRRSPEGIVDCILERENKLLLAKVKLVDEQLYGIPIDDRILAKIKLGEEDNKYLYKKDQNNIVIIKIDMFPIAQLEGTGHVIKELKLNSSEENDNEFVLAKNNINLSRKKINLQIIEPEITERLDLTSNDTFMLKSWKHKNSPLLPLFHVEKDNKQNYRIWIHTNSISERINFSNKDILEYFNDNFESLPMTNKWADFLDKNIIKNSEFKVNEENIAISLCITLSNDHEIIDWSFHLTKVKCSAIIENKHLQALTKRKSRSKSAQTILEPIEKYIDKINLLIEISNKLRQKHILNGKFEIPKEISKIRKLREFYCHKPGQYINDYLEPLSFLDAQTFISPILYEADNIWFKHSHNYKIKNISFDSENLNYVNVNELIKHSQIIDTSIELDDEGNLTLNNLLNQCQDKNKRRVIYKYLINNMRNNYARLNDYKDDKNQENDLLYSHSPWTLPANDFVNLVNQYSIFNMFKNGKQSKNSKVVNIYEKDSWHKINWDLFNLNSLKVTNLLFSSLNVEKYNNFVRKSSLYISNMINLKQIREAEKLVGNDFKGLIMTVQSYGFFVELPELLIEGLVHVSTLNDDWYEYRSRQNLLVGRKSKNVYQVGDEINVKITKVDILKYQIDLEVSS